MNSTNLIASPGKFIVVGVDTFSHEDWVQGEYDTLEKAVKVAKQKTKGEEMLKMYVYNDKGEYLHGEGTF